MFAGRWRARGAGRAREQISPLSETTSWNSRYSRAPKIGARIARAKRPAEREERRRRRRGERSVKGRADERRGIEATKKRRRRRGEDGEENEIKCRDEAFRISSSDPARRWKREGREGDGPKEDPAQSGDKRVVRTVLNRSEYLYAASSFAPFLPCLCRRLLLPLLPPPPLLLLLPRASTRGPMRYLLDYPVLINSSGFIFIFLVGRHLAHEVSRERDSSGYAARTIAAEEKRREKREERRWRREWSSTWKHV